MDLRPHIEKFRQRFTEFLRALRIGKSVRRTQQGFNLGKALAKFFDVRTEIHFSLATDVHR